MMNGGVKMKIIRVASIVTMLLMGIGCSGNVQDSSSPYVEELSDGSIELFDGRLIPPMPELLGVRAQYDLRNQWLVKKHEMLLPMMRRHGIEMWLVVNEEFHDDPVTEYIAPDRCYVGRREVHAFVDAGSEGLKRFSDLRRPTADYKIFFEPMPGPRNARGFQDTAVGLKAIYAAYDPKTIALNMGGRRGQANGLTVNSYRFLVKTLGKAAEKRFVSAEPLIEEYFDTRLPEEWTHYQQLVLATDVLAQRALSNVVITPGETTANDVKWWWYQQIASLETGSEPWFTIHFAIQHYDEEKGEATPWKDPCPDAAVFQPGDVIHMDCGFNYLGFASDWQKVAYILKEGEEDAPEGLKVALKNANLTQEALCSACRPGMTGYEAAVAAVKKIEGVDFMPDIYSHPIGYQGHGMGPSINARQMTPREDELVLRLGGYRSIELAATTHVPEWGGAPLRVPMEDDAYLAEDGYHWFRPPQTSWYLIH